LPPHVLLVKFGKGRNHAWFGNKCSVGTLRFGHAFGFDARGSAFARSLMEPSAGRAASALFFGANSLSPARSTWLKYGGFTGWVGGQRLAGALMTAITFPLIVRRLGVDMYGTWSYVIAVLSFLDLLSNPGLTSHAGQQVAARQTDASDVVSDSLVLRGFLGVLVVALVLIFAALEVRPEAARLLRFYGVCITLVNLTSTEYLLASLELFYERSLLTVIQQALYTVGVVAMVRSPKDYIWVPASILLSTLPTNLGGWIILHRKGLRIRLGLNTQRWWSLLVPSGHYALGSVMSSLYHRTGHLVVRWVLGEYALGLYAAATRLVDFIRSLVSIGFIVIAPWVARSVDSPSSLRRLVRFSVGGIALVGLPLVVGIFTTARILVPIVLGSQYIESARLLPWLAPYVVIAPLAVLFSGTVLYSLGLYRKYLISTVVGAGVACSAYFLLVPLAGLRGASVAFVLGEAAVALAGYRLSPAAARDVWNSPLLRVAGVATAIMTATLLVALRLHVQPLRALLASGILYALICGWHTRARILTEMRRVD
jgi:PST family polysaccharide transporter